MINQDRASLRRVQTHAVLCNKWVLGLLALTIGGCAMEAHANQGGPLGGRAAARSRGDAVATTAEALTARVCSPYTDDSGTVTVQVCDCGWSVLAQHNMTICSPDSDFVLVGGGAEIEGEGTPGALLTISAPDDDGSGNWLAQSKDNQIAYPHRLKAYAIGLKLQGLSTFQLRNMVTITWAVNGPAMNHPSSTAFIPEGHIRLGGGAWGDGSSSAGQYLTGSSPSGHQTDIDPSTHNTWTAFSKDHLVADPGWVWSAAISIPNPPPNFTGGCFLEENIRVSEDVWGQGYEEARTSLQLGYATTSIGGLLHAGAGETTNRLLTDLIPSLSNGDVIVRSKDHSVIQFGATNAKVVGIRRGFCP